MSGYEWRSNEEKCMSCDWGEYREQGVDYWCVACPENMNTTSSAAISKDLCVPGSGFHFYYTAVFMYILIFNR